MAESLYSCTVFGKKVTLSAKDSLEATNKLKFLYPKATIRRGDVTLVEFKDVEKSPVEIIKNFKKI